MTVTWSWALEAYISAAWVDISRDVLIFDHPLTASRGIEGFGVTDRVASPGSLTAYLDNSEANSAGLLGYYSPDNANMRSNFARDTRVRLKLVYDGDTQYIWHGWIDDLKPAPGQFKERTTFLTASDYMQKLAERKVELLGIQEDKRGDQLVTTVVANVPTAPLATSYGTDTFTLELAFHNDQDERSTPMSVLQKICQTTLAYCFIKGDATGGETFVYQREATRVGQASSATLDDTMSAMKISRNIDQRKDRVIGIVHPSNVDITGDIVLARLVNELPIDAGDTQTITLRFRDPNNQAVRIAGKDIVDPLVADTHYTMTATQGGSGNDMNASLAVVLTAGGNTVQVALTNNGAVRGYVNFLEVVGNGIYLYDPVDVVVESGDGEKSMTYDFYYLEDYYKGKDFTTAIHKRTSEEYSNVEQVTFFADASATLMGYAMTVDIGDRVTITETATGIDSDFTVNKATYTVMTDGRLRVDWVMEPAGVYSFFILDSSELDGADVLSPF